MCSGSACATTPVPTGIVNAVSLTAGYTDYCAILTSGTVDCWGNGVRSAESVTGLTGVKSLVSDDGNGGYCRASKIGSRLLLGQQRLR